MTDLKERAAKRLYAWRTGLMLEFVDRDWDMIEGQTKTMAIDEATILLRLAYSEPVTTRNWWRGWRGRCSKSSSRK